MLYRALWKKRPDRIGPAEFWLDDRSFGTAVQRMRSSLGWDPQDVQYAAGLASGHIYKIEDGEVTVGLNILDRIARAFGVRPSELLAYAEAIHAGQHPPPPTPTRAEGNPNERPALGPRTAPDPGVPKNPLRTVKTFRTTFVKTFMKTFTNAIDAQPRQPVFRCAGWPTSPTGCELCSKPRARVAAT